MKFYKLTSRDLYEIISRSFVDLNVSVSDVMFMSPNNNNINICIVNVGYRVLTLTVCGKLVTVLRIRFILASRILIRFMKRIRVAKNKPKS